MCGTDIPVLLQTCLTRHADKLVLRFRSVQEPRNGQEIAGDASRHR